MPRKRKTQVEKEPVERAVSPAVKLQRFKKGRVGEADRDTLTATLLHHLLRPGLIAACQVLIADMAENNDVTSAKAIIQTAKELIQKGFPEPSDRDRAEALQEELRGLEDNIRPPRGGTSESADPEPEAAALEQDASGLLTGQEDL